jgi:ABC-2 type transport system permease protein
MPVSRNQTLAGKLLAALLIGLLQVAIMFAIGHFMFGMSLGQAPLALILLTITLVAAAVSMGLATAAFNLENVLILLLCWCKCRW